MQLREIHIDGFGVFADARIRDAAPGLNVLYGRNEFGKTTLLEFIRRILFGFPGKSPNVNPYPALRGGKYGGSLVCRLRDPGAPEITVSRTTGKGGGALSVRRADGIELSEEAFKAALGHVSDEFYRNVYAISLQELQEDKKRQLQGEELRNRIYGAGLGLGQVSITELKRSFSDAADELYKPRGSIQMMNATASALLEIEKQIRQKSSELSHYDARKTERDGLIVERDELRSRQRVLQTEARVLESQRDLFDTFVHMRNDERELAESGSLPDIPDAAMEELRTQERAIESLEKNLRESQSQRTGKLTDLEALTYDPALLQHESDIKALLSGLTQFKDALRDLPVRDSEQRAAQERASRAISELGEGWSRERVKSFLLTTEQRDAINVAADNLRAELRAAEKAKDRLEDYRNQSRASRSRPGLPLTYRIIGVAILALGAAGCVYSAVNGFTVPAVVSGIAAALGLAVALSLGSTSGPLRDRTVEELSADIDRTEQHLAAAQSAWSSQLASTGLAPALTPDAVAEQLRSLSSLQESLASIDERQARIGQMQEVIGSARRRLAAVIADLAVPMDTADTASAIERLDALLDSAQQRWAERERIQRDLQSLDRQADGLARDLELARERLAAFLASFSTTSGEDFRVLYERATRARALRDDIRRNTLAIQKATGVDEPYRQFLARMETTTPEQVLSRLSEVNGELAELEPQLEAVSQQIGGLERDISSLTSGEALLEMETRAEGLRQQLRDAHRDWVRTQIALWAINQAISKYETTRQPAVIQSAQAAFSTMTGGSYTTLVSPLGSSELYVRHQEGKDRTIDELSRGTREQLYLAMRLGLIEQYELNAEPLPVVMDDIFVNFDDARASLAVQALVEFARDRQVIVMTCHERTQELCSNAGARELTLERSLL